MSPPSPSKPPPQRPLSATTSTKARKVTFQEPHNLIAANALVKLATSSGNEDITAKPNDRIANIANGPVKVAKKGTKTVVLELDSSKQHDGKREEHPVKARKDGPGEPRKRMPANALVEPTSSGIVRSNKASELATEPDIESKIIALRLRSGDFKISDDALKLLERGVKTFVLNLLEKDKRQGNGNPIKKAQQRILAEKREADRRKKQQEWVEENLPARLKRLKDAMEVRKELGKSEELRLLWEADIRATVAAYKDLFTTTTDLERAIRRLELETASHEDLFGPGGDLGGDFSFLVYAPLEKDDGKQSEGVVKTQQWVLLEDSGWDHRTRRKFAEEARLTPEFVLREGASVLEFTFGPIADVKKPADADGGKATMPEGPGTVAAASEAVDNAKLKGAPDVQHAAAKKLDPSTNLATPTATADEVLATALTDIDISKTKRPSTTAPKPQHQPPPETRSSLASPFYRPDMTLAIAAQNIVAYFREAADWLNFWHISAPASTLVDMSHKPTSTLSRILCHFRWTAEFLRLGRVGWDLRRLPDNFFEDVLPLIMVTCGKLEKLGDLKGCEDMMVKAWKDAEEVGEMLATVRNVRARDAKGNEARW